MLDSSNKFNFNSNFSKQEQIINDLILIIDKNFKAGDRFYSERELVNRYQVSRGTIRNVFNDLEQFGIIYRIANKGTYVGNVNSNKETLGLQFSQTEMLKKRGKEMENEIISFKRMKPNLLVARELENNEDVYVIERVRHFTGDNYNFEINSLPVSFVPNLTEEMVKSYPLKNILTDIYKLKLITAQDRITASILNTQEAKYLHKNENDPCLKVYQKIKISTGETVQFSTIVSPSDSFEYAITHTI